MNSNPNSKRLLWLVLLGACLAGGGFFVNHVLQRRNDFYQEQAYEEEVMSELRPVAADPWQDGTNAYSDSQPLPARAFSQQMDTSSFLQAARGETTVTASSSLQAAVTQEFEAKQKLQEAQVQLLEQRVKELRKILEYRNANRRKIISDRVRELSGIETESLSKVQSAPGPNFEQPKSPMIGRAVVQQMPPRKGTLHANPTPFRSNRAHPSKQRPLPQLSSQPQVQGSAVLDSLGVEVRPSEQTDGMSYANTEALEEPTTAANFNRTNLLADDQVTLLGSISSRTGVNTPVRESDFGPQNKLMRAVALGMFRGEKGVFLSADEETFVMQASPSQHERFAAVAHEIFTSPYVNPDRLVAHIRDLEFKSKRMQSLLEAKDDRSPFVKEGRRKLEESLRRNEDLIAAFEAIIDNHKRSSDISEEVAVPQPDEAEPVFEERPAETGPIFEQPDEVLELSTEPAVDYYEAPVESTSAEPVVESSDLPKGFSQGPDSQAEKESTKGATDSFGLNTESR